MSTSEATLGLKLRNPFKKKRSKKKEPSPRRDQTLDMFGMRFGLGANGGLVFGDQEIDPRQHSQTPLLDDVGLEADDMGLGGLDLHGAGLLGWAEALGTEAMTHGAPAPDERFTRRNGRRVLDVERPNPDLHRPPSANPWDPLPLEGRRLDVDGIAPSAPERDRAPEQAIGVGANGWGQLARWQDQDVFLKRGYRAEVQLAESILLNEANRLAAIESVRHDRRGGDRVMGYHGAGMIDAPEGPEPALMTELARGGDLKGLLEDEGPLPTGRVLDLGTDMLAGVGFLNDLGLVHQDLKADNILLADEGRTEARVGDLGSLSHWGPDTGYDGTQGVHHVDHEADVATGRSDHFSAGMLLLDMLLGLDARQAYGDLQDQGAIDEALALDFATLREQRGEDEQADLDVLTAEIARMMRFDGAERPSAWESHDRLANHRR